MDQVFPRLFVSSLKEAEDELLLSRSKVALVVNVAHWMPTAVFASSFDYLHVPLHDTLYQEIVTAFPQIFRKIDEQLSRRDGSTVLIHCLAGRSRSAAVALAYILYSLFLRQSYEDWDDGYYDLPFSVKSWKAAVGLHDTVQQQPTNQPSRLIVQAALAQMVRLHSPTKINSNFENQIMVFVQNRCSLEFCARRLEQRQKQVRRKVHAMSDDLDDFRKDEEAKESKGEMEAKKSAEEHLEQERQNMKEWLATRSRERSSMWRC